MTEHEEKYEALARTLGVEALKAMVPATREEVERALRAGDEHLYTIPLMKWDKAAGVAPIIHGMACPTCGRKGPSRDPSQWPYEDLKASALGEPWRRAPTLSLAERVCVLKHVAKYHLIGKVPA